MSKIYRQFINEMLERKTGERWSRLGSGLLQVRVCQLLLRGKLFAEEFRRTRSGREGGLGLTADTGRSPPPD